MVIVHDDDLVTIDGLGHDAVSEPLNTGCIVLLLEQSVETLEPDVIMDLFQRSDIEIDKVLCGELSVSTELRLRLSQRLPYPKIYPRLMVVQTPIRLLSRWLCCQ